MNCPQCQNELPEDQKGKRCPVCATSATAKNRLWILIVPPLLSLTLISAIKPSGPFAFWTEISIFCLCSLFCGSALAMKQFKKTGHRIWGALAFSAGGMYLICCMSFMGCFWLFETPALSPAQLQQQMRQSEIERKASTAKHIVPRDALADSSMLDLSPFYNEVIPRPEPRWPSFVFQKPGTHVWDGIKFDVRGTIDGIWLVETNTIAVGKKCSEIYFLHGAREQDFSTLANQFFIHFQNGITITIPIIDGTDVWDCNFANGLNGVAPTNAVIWEQRLFTNAPPKPVDGFFIKKWENPIPDDTITSIGFAPRDTGFLVAITIKEATNSIP